MNGVHMKQVPRTRSLAVNVIDVARSSRRSAIRRLHVIPAAAMVVPLISLPVSAVRADSTPDDSAGQAADQPPVSVATLAGMWRLDEARSADGEVGADVGGVLMMLGTDSTFALDSLGTIATKPSVAGTYELDGGTVVTRPVSGSCTEAIDFAVEMPEEGRLLTTVTETGSPAPMEKACPIPVGTELDWVRVSPMSAPGATVANLESVEDTRPPSIQTVFGIWHRQGSGQLLRMGIDGTYSFDDGGLLDGDPDDTGTFELDGQTVSFTSTGSASCAAGETHVWEQLTIGSVRLQQHDVRLTRLVSATASGSDCPVHAAGTQTWLRISP
jgi:hypothetical protein